jgi:type I restriction enzyme, S subunit
MKYGLSEKQLKDIETILAAWPDIDSVWLFGSRALGSYKEASDIDLAIKGHLEPKTLIRLKDAFEESDLPFFVDLVAYADITEPALKKHIDDFGVCVYGEGEGKCDWTEAPLGDLINLKRGYDLPSKSRIEGRVPIFSSSGISGFHNEKMADGPGVVTGRYGTIGQVFYASGTYWPLNTTLYVQDFKGSNPKFVYYFLQQLDWEKYSDKSAVPGVNRNDVHQERVAFPQPPEQQSIAAVLSRLDDKIDLLHRQNQTLETMAATLFRQWFVEEVEEKDWGFVELREYVNCFNGVSYKSEDLKSSNTAMVTLKSFDREGGFRLDGFKSFTGKYKEQHLVTQGDLVVAHTDITQDAAVVGSPVLVVADPEYEKLVISMDLVKVTSKYEWISNEFLYGMMRTREFKQHCLGYSNGSTVLHLNKDAIPAYEFFMPPKEKIQAFTRLAKGLLGKKFENIVQTRTLEKLRNTLLPKLMSGEVRVAV